MPSYLSFVKGVTNGDYLPLNIPREMQQQHKLLQVIRKMLDMIKRISDGKHAAFWPNFPTNTKLSLTKDTASLAEYFERMKDRQEHIFYIASGSADEVKVSPVRGEAAKEGVRGALPDRGRGRVRLLRPP